MDDKVRCQSCGMPVSDEFANFGTMADGAKNPEYCSFCFQNGAFTNPDQTLGEMLQSSVDFMTANLGFTVENATEMSNKVIPNLRRWKSS